MSLGNATSSQSVSVIIVSYSATVLSAVLEHELKNIVPEHAKLDTGKGMRWNKRSVRH